MDPPGWVHILNLDGIVLRHSAGCVFFVLFFFVESSSPQKLEDSTFFGVVGLSGSGDSGWSHKKGWNSQISLSKGLSKHFLQSWCFHVYLFCIRRCAIFFQNFNSSPFFLVLISWAKNGEDSFLVDFIFNKGEIYEAKGFEARHYACQLCQVVREDDNKQVHQSEIFCWLIFV